jgi:hypothetical protein
VQRGLLLDVVVGQGAAILQLLAGKDQALLVRGDACNTTSNSSKSVVRSVHAQHIGHYRVLLRGSRQPTVPLAALPTYCIQQVNIKAAQS